MKITLKDKGQNRFDVLDNNYKIASGELFVDYKYWLNKITLEDDCHNRSYGSAIINHLKENYKPFRVSLSSKTAHYHINKNINDSRCLTQQDFNLVKRCFQDGILGRQNFEFPYPDILIQYISDTFLDYRTPNLLNFANTILITINSNIQNRL